MRVVEPQAEPQTVHKAPTRYGRGQFAVLRPVHKGWIQTNRGPGLNFLWRPPFEMYPKHLCQADGAQGPSPMWPMPGPVPVSDGVGERRRGVRG